MTKTEMMMILGPALAGGLGSVVNSRQQSQQNQMTMVDRQMQALQQKAQMLQGLQQNRQQMAQAGLNAMPLGQEQAYASRAKAMQALLPALAQYQGARPTDPGIAGATRSSGPNLVQALAGNQGFQNTFSDQMTSQAMADRRKAIAAVNPQYEFSSLGGFGMDPSYDQTVDDARGTALARLKGFEGQQQALADQQVQLAMNGPSQSQGQEKKGGGLLGGLGRVLKIAAPIAAMAIPAVGPMAAMAIAGGGTALGSKMSGDSWASSLGQGALSAGIGGVGKSLATGGGFNPFNNGAGQAMNNGMSAASLPLGSGAGQTMASKAGAMNIPSAAGGPSWLSGAKQAGQSMMTNMATSQAGFEGNNPMIGMGNISTQAPQGPPKLPMFNKADPRGAQGLPPQMPKPPMPFALGHGPQPSQPMPPQPSRADLQSGANRGQQLTPDQLQQAYGPASMAYMNQQYPDPGQALQGIMASIPAFGKMLGGAPAAVARPQMPTPVSTLPQRTAQFNQMWQEGMAKPSVPTQLNAQSIMRVLSGNNGMSPQDKAKFLASPEAQSVLQQIVRGQ